MSKIEIPHEQWSSFFYEFNRQNSDKIVKIEVTDEEDYRTAYAESLPLREVMITSQNDNNTVISVSAGASNSFYHTIDRSWLVTLEEKNEKVKALEIKSSSGRTLIIRFHPLDENDDLM